MTSRISTTPDVLALREVFARDRIMLCFNGPVTATLIEEIGIALRNYMEGLSETTTAVSDVFSIYIEITQNIRRYTADRPHLALETAGIFVSRDDEGNYVVSASNVVEPADGQELRRKIDALGEMDKADLKAAFKAQLRRPHGELSGSAGLGLIDMARKARQPLCCAVIPLDETRSLFTLRVVL